MLACSFGKKVWGKWFYASPAIDQYERNASLVGFSTVIKKVILLGSQRYIGDVIKTNMFYQKESVYLNLHISNKLLQN
jgi:hypothetical protein